MELELEALVYLLKHFVGPGGEEEMMIYWLECTSSKTCFYALNNIPTNSGPLPVTKLLTSSWEDHDMFEWLRLLESSSLNQAWNGPHLILYIDPNYPYGIPENIFNFFLMDVI